MARVLWCHEHHEPQPITAVAAPPKQVRLNHVGAWAGESSFAVTQVWPVSRKNLD